MKDPSAPADGVQTAPAHGEEAPAA
jgi:hypothetical protein